MKLQVLPINNCCESFYVSLTGTALYFGWSSCASLIGGVVVLVYKLGLSMDIACWIALVILMTILIVWFSLETFAFDRQLRCEET